MVGHIKVECRKRLNELKSRKDQESRRNQDAKRLSERYSFQRNSEAGLVHKKIKFNPRKS